MASLALVVPVYCYENSILKTLEKIQSWKIAHPDHRIQVILSDDGSRDQTVGQIKKWISARAASSSDWKLLEHSQNRGKGFVVREGIQHALAQDVDYIVFTDCDLFYGLEVVFDRVIPELETHDIVILDRSWRRSLIPVSLIRYFASEVFVRLLSILTGVSFRDTQAGLKGFNSKKCRPIFDVLTLQGFAFDVEILSVALYFRFRIKQIPIRFMGKIQPEKSSVNLMRSSAQMFFDLLRINWNWRQKKYHSANLIGRIENELYTIQVEE